MRQEIMFVPLGGGQRVGASCYYLKLGNSNIILDAGTGIENGLIFEPDYHLLLASKYLESLNQIDHIFISHAHIDHVGSLLPLLQEAKHAEVYMTELTECLARYQLYDKSYLEKPECKESERLAAESLLERVTKVSFLETMDFGEYKVTFYPAGHIPGAMMMLFEYKNRKILYTGDYSIHQTALTDGCVLPKATEIDTVIMCGLHAKHPRYHRSNSNMTGYLSYLLEQVKQGVTVRCHVSQLSKGVEFLKLLNEANKTGVPIYIEPSIQPVIRRLEQLKIPLLEKTNYMADIPCRPHICITAEARPYRKDPFVKTEIVNFSLHEDFWEMQELVSRINPKWLYLVHCGRPNDPEDETIEQRLMWDAKCRTQVVFAEEQQFYYM